jgi:hypothetical protein
MPAAVGVSRGIRADHVSPGARAARTTVVRTTIGRASGDAAPAHADHAQELKPAMSVSWLNEQVSSSGALRPRSGRPEQRRGAAPAPDAALGLRWARIYSTCSISLGFIGGCSEVAHRGRGEIITADSAPTPWRCGTVPKWASPRSWPLPLLWRRAKFLAQLSDVPFGSPTAVRS